MSVRIAHLSDIHLERADGNVADRLEAALVNVKPDILAITGDIVDHFWRLQKGKEWLLNLCSSLKIDAEKRMLIVPGNHDYRAFGNFGFRPITGLFFKRLFKNWSERRIVLFPDFRLTFFRIDSNPIIRGFARGSVSAHQIACLKQEVASLKREDREFVHHSTKVALIHHHPLPVPREGSDFFLILDKVQNVLQFLGEQNIDCVLHGHKHRAPHSLLSLGTCGGRTRIIQVVAAGTAVAESTDREARGHNFNLVTVEDSGLIYTRQFFAQPGNDFEELDDTPFVSEIFDSASYRAAAKRGYKYEDVHWECQIDVEADTFNMLTYRGLRRLGSGPLAETDSRTYSCDTGHVSAPQLVESKTSTGVSLKVIKQEPRRVDFDINFNPPLTSTAEPMDFSFQQYDFNTLAVDRESFRRKFPTRTDETESEEKVLTEVTGSFSWTLAFPFGFELQRPPRFEVFDEDDRRHDWLTTVLQRSFTFSENLNVAFVNIQSPPSGYRYRISWDLPPAEVVPEVPNPGHAAEVERFARVMLGLAKQRGEAGIQEIVSILSTFAHAVAERVEVVTQTRNVVSPEQLEVSLMVYDDLIPLASPRLRVVAATQHVTEEPEAFSLEIGDGNAGRAYSRNSLRVFDAVRAKEHPIYQSYVQRNGLGTHFFLYSIPLRHPETQHLIFGVVNVGTYDRAQGKLLKALNNDEGNSWLIDFAHEYLLSRLIEIARM